MTERMNFFTSRGRFVSGDMDKLRTVDHQRKPLDPAKHQYDFGIAFPKADIWPLISEQMYPWLWSQWASKPDLQERLQRWMAQPGLAGKMGGLSMKIADGDAPNSKGQVNEHTKGCFVIYMSSFGMGDGTKVQVQNPAQPPKIVAGPNVDTLQEIPLTSIKRGDYVAIAGSLSPNGNDGDNAGQYVNCDTVWLLEQGEAISGGADPSEQFKGAGLQGSYDPSNGAGAAFGGATPPPPPAGNASAPAPTLPGSAPAPEPTTSAPPLPGSGTPVSPSTASAPTPDAQFRAPPLPGN